MIADFNAGIDRAAGFAETLRLRMARNPNAAQAAQVIAILGELASGIRSLRLQEEMEAGFIPTRPGEACFDVRSA